MKILTKMLMINSLTCFALSPLPVHAKENGNKLPKSLRVSANAPIEKVAFQIVTEAIKLAPIAKSEGRA